jgi:Tfp pilus assembly protein PilF
VKKENQIKENNLKNTNNTQKISCLILLLVLIITASVFSGSLRLDWTNWDDDLYVYENRFVRDGDIKNIIIPPSDSAMYNVYSPIVISSFALEWKLVKDRPFLYHLNNVLLHILCTALVWLFFRNLGLSIWWSGFAALLFGIHPMRVESVAWITERKDLLYSFFYLTALLAYIRYLASGKVVTLLLVFILFILSLYSKVQAITLPFALILLDWYFKRKIDWKVVSEKLLFFAGSLTIGLSFVAGINFLTRKADIITSDKILIFFKQIIYSVYAYTEYILKSFIPYATSPLYPLPVNLTAEHWIGVAIAFIIFISALVMWRRYRYVTFGVLFFTFNIILLPFASAVGDSTFLNDRYTYVAYIGLFFIMAMSMQRLAGINTFLCISTAVFACVILTIFGALTVKYIPVWKNSETLWTHVIEKYPRQIPIAYLNRGHYFYEKNQSAKAIEDLNTAIDIHPEYLHAYFNRGFIYLTNNDLENALKDYNRILELMSSYNTGGAVLNPGASDAFANRGLIYSRMGKYEKALSDLNSAIAIDPQNIVHYLNRAFVYIDMGEYEKSIGDLTLYLQSDPANSDVVNNRGVCYMRLGHYESALADFSRAILINGSNASYYTNRAWVYRKVGLDEKAQKDLQIAEKLAQ